MLRKSHKVAGFLVATTGAVAAVALAVPATGAYFQDAHSGTASASVGTVAIKTSSDTLSFAGLLPGESKTQQVDVTNTGSEPETIHFDMPAGIPANYVTLSENGSPAQDPSGGVSRVIDTIPAGDTHTETFVLGLNSTVGNTPSESGLEGQSLGSYSYKLTGAQQGQ